MQKLEEVRQAKHPTQGTQTLFIWIKDSGQYSWHWVLKRVKGLVQDLHIDGDSQDVHGKVQEVHLVESGKVPNGQACVQEVLYK